MREITGRRSLNSKHFDNGDDTLTMEAYSGHIYYQDGLNFELIDTTLESILNGWLQTKASYHLVLPRYADERIIFNDRFNANREIMFTPEADHIQGVLVNEIDGLIQKRVRYEDCFGKGIHLECTAGSIAFSKEIVIDADPRQSIEIRFKLELPAEKLLIGGKQDVIGHLQDLEDKAIIVGDSDDADALTYLRKAVARDNDRNNINIPMRIEIVGRDTFLVKTIPAAFLRDAEYPVRSDVTTSYYIGSGDGYVLCYDFAPGNWDNVHIAGSGTFRNAVDGDSYANLGCLPSFLSGHGIIRGFFPVDTSGLPDTTVIHSAILKLRPKAISYDDNDAQAYMGIVQTSQASPTAIIAADFLQCGAVDNPTLGADTIRIENLTTGVLNNFTLNATGLSWIKKTAGDPYTMLGCREGHDIEDVATANVTDDNTADIYFSEVGTPGWIPSLSVTYGPPTKYLILIK